MDLVLCMHLFDSLWLHIGSLNIKQAVLFLKSKGKYSKTERVIYISEYCKRRKEGSREEGRKAGKKGGRREEKKGEKISHLLVCKLEEIPAVQKSNK